MEKKSERCVIVGGAPIGDYSCIRSYLRADDYVIYCDSGLDHLEGLGAEPSLIVGDFDSSDNPHMDIETIVLPTVKDDTDTVYAIREGIRRGYTDFLLAGVFGARLDHTLSNIYSMFSLTEQGYTVTGIDDYSELSVIAEGTTAYVEDKWPFFSLINMTGTARGITITGAKYLLDDAEITSGYQYGVSNEVLPGHTASISIREGNLLLIRDF